MITLIIDRVIRNGKLQKLIVFKKKQTVFYPYNKGRPSKKPYV